MVDPYPADLAAAILDGDRRALARGITLIESTRCDHRAASSELLESLMPHTGGSTRVGISGPPGVGKSTFIEALGNHVIAAGKRIAVLTVDPSSAISGGSILGDKTRMEELARRDKAFIRPSPSGNTPGGVTRRSRESLLLCEAAGYDLIVVETVGVGQSEIRVADMTDMFVLLLLPGSGDQLQGIKRGIMELADLILINKADGDMKAIARDTAVEYRNALRLLRPRSPAWAVEVQTCSALNNAGIDTAWNSIVSHQEMLNTSGALNARRAQQARSWMWSEVQDSLLAELAADPDVQSLIAEIESAVSQGRIPAAVAAGQLMDTYMKRGG